MFSKEDVNSIFNMAKAVCHSDRECKRCNGYKENTCNTIKYAAAYYNAGCREQSEVTSKIIAEIEKIIDERRELERRRAWEARVNQKEALAYKYTENTLSLVKLRLITEIEKTK